MRRDWYEGVRAAPGVERVTVALCAVDFATWRARRERRAMVVYRAGGAFYVRAHTANAPGGAVVLRTIAPEV